MIKIWLIMLLHLGALRRAPLVYMTVLKLRMLGKRVRAARQFGALLAQSPYAYRLWIHHKNANGHTCTLYNDARPIIAFVVAERLGPVVIMTLEHLRSERVEAFAIVDPLGGDIEAAVEAIDWNTHPWIMTINAGDRLAPGAVVAYQQAIAETDCTVIYADDDCVDAHGCRYAPHFKPDWNPELFGYYDYLTGACIIKADRREVEAVANTVDWASRLVARAVGGDGAHHLRAMLHHRALRPLLPTSPKPLRIDDPLPRITVAIATRNRHDLLRKCLEGVANTHYTNLEVIVVDNDSDDPETLDYLAAQDPARIQIIRHAGPFNFSRINNRAVAMSSGELICLLNNDIEVLDPKWLAIMATQALRDDVGAVGAQLLYPDGRIQHAGVAIGIGDATGHAHRFVRPEAEGYFRRHALPQFVSAVTAACLVVRRDRFLAVGGLDEVNFPVAFNDVDLCLRLNARGWQSFYEPRAVLIHHESVSRGHDRDPVGAARFAGELAALQRIWHTDKIVDPYHHPQLSRAAEQFVVAI